MFTTENDWPFATLLKYDIAPYTVPSPRQVEEACAWGDISMRGHSLFAARLDMSLAGLMAEIGGDFFISDMFESRFAAARDILIAARVFLEKPVDGRASQEKRVRLLYEETETVLRDWAENVVGDNQGTMLLAAEESAELE